MSCICDLHLEAICTGSSSVAINGVKELGANVLLFCKKCVETGKRQRQLESDIAKQIEESVKSLELVKKLMIEQKLTQVVEDPIQVSVNEALQKTEINYADVAAKYATLSSREKPGEGKGKSSKSVDRCFQSSFRVQGILQGPEM